MSITRKIQIIYETDDFLAMNKPAPLLVHPVPGKKEDNLVEWLLEKHPEVKGVGDRPDVRPGIVHRLDRNTSGILIVARNQEFFDYFKKLLKERKVEKTYLALVWGKIEKKGIVDTPIGLKPDTTRWAVKGKLKMVKSALTEYEPIKHCRKDSNDFTLMKLHPKTGRTHQLRVHLASINHSVVGDDMYGRKEDPFGLGRQFLHASLLEFKTREGERVRLEAPLPSDLRQILENLACG